MSLTEDQIEAIKEFTKSEEFKAQVKEAFDKCDADGSGAIDQAELMTVLNELHGAIASAGHEVPAPTQDDVDAIIKEFDASADGKLQFDEFRKFLKELFTAMLAALASA